MRPIICVCAAVTGSANSSIVCASANRLSFVKVRIRCRRVCFSAVERQMNSILANSASPNSLLSSPVNVLIRNKAVSRKPAPGEVHRYVVGQFARRPAIFQELDKLFQKAYRADHREMERLLNITLAGSAERFRAVGRMVARSPPARLSYMTP
jgi:hypothetical protein